MAIFKNIASQKIAVFAYDTAADAPKTGDAANITAQISLNGAATAATNDTNPTELDATDAPGIYLFDMTQAETNTDLIILSAVSSTGDVSIEPVLVYTLPTYANTQVAQTGDSYARIGSTGSGLTSLAQASVLGTLATSAATGDPNTSKTVMGYAKQLVNVLIGAAGIATFPAESAPGDGVSLAEVLRAIAADVTGLNGAVMRGTDSAATASNLTTAQSSLTDIQSRLPAALVSGKMNSDTTAISGSTTAADNLEQSSLGIVVGAALTGTLSTTQATTNLTETTDSHYSRRLLLWVTGVLAGQATVISAYNGTSKLLTFDTLTEAPGNGDGFVIL